jgi:hypothetical protein
LLGWRNKPRWRRPSIGESLERDRAPITWWASSGVAEIVQREENVKSKILAWMVATIVMTALVMPVRLAAQAQHNKPRDRSPKISILDEQHCCEFFETNPDSAVYFCSAAIQSGRLSKANLAIAFNDRGNASSKKRDYEGRSGTTARRYA